VKPLFAALALAATLGAAPAFAQSDAPPPPPPPQGGDLAMVPDIDTIHSREERDGARIQHAVDAGDLAPGEAHRLREELVNIRTQEAELARRDGAELNATDRQFINDRLNQLGHTIHWVRTEADWTW
jgi:hypothetical protein